MTEYPSVIHIQITDQCNKNCSLCRWTGRIGHLDYEFIRQLIIEGSGKVSTICLGGGEPFLHPNLEDICNTASGHRIGLSITTNGTIFRMVQANRIHFSIDSFHGWSDPFMLEEFVGDSYKVFGINSVITSEEDIKKALHFLNRSYVSNVILLAPKSRLPSGELDIGPRLIAKMRDTQELIPQVWLDPCFTKCRQGITSMHIDVEGMAGLCSHTLHPVKYTNLKETWGEVQKLKCIRARH